MSKFSRLVAALMASIMLMPAFIPLAQAEDDQPIVIKSATVVMKGTRVTGEVKICNSEKEQVKFLLDVKNMTINSLYKRNLMVAGSDCAKFKLSFTSDFAEMSNVADKIRFLAKSVKGVDSEDEFDNSNTYTAKVTESADRESDCADQHGEDGVFAACETGFIYHEPSGLRIKVVDRNPDFLQLKLIHVEWGGVKDMRIYKGRTKKIRSNYDELERLEISNLYGEKGNNDLYLKIESQG